LKQRPNLLFVFADQLRYDALGCNGNQEVHTPTLDRLAREGLVLDQAYSSCPLCAPYRGQLLTGNYAHVNGVICNEYRLFPHQKTMAHMLREAGYKTAFIGKWHLGYGPYDVDKRHGFDDLYAYNCDHSYFKIPYWHNERGPIAMGGYAPQVETQLTIDYISDHIAQKPEQPFFVALGWGPPHHNPLPNSYSQYPQEFDIYDPQALSLPPNFPRQFLPFARDEMAGYYGMVTSLDACMKQLLDFLDSAGLADDTIVCFTTDHGDHLSAHGYGKPYDRWMAPHLRAAKATPHEESIHVPFILRYPRRMPAGSRSTTMLSSVDILPTLLAIMGQPLETAVQGRDLSAALLGGETESPDSVYLQILGPGWPNRVRWVGLWRGVRTRDFVYARWNFPDQHCILYDCRHDPYEMVNVADDPAYKSIVRDHEERLRYWIAETEDPFDVGPRLPQTGMLDLGQVFTHPKWLEQAPQEYARAVARHHGRRLA
jgi:arylsulfatase A-like enzyme